MRALTITGFMASYVQGLADVKTLNIHKLYKNVISGNFRLKEPLFLYCFHAEKSDVLLRYLNETDKEEYKAVTEILKNGSISELPDKYRKAVEAYEFRRDRYNNEIRIKALMVQRIQQMQKKKHITNYRIYTDLHINAGNFNDFIKNKKYNKLSLDKSREVMNYLSGL